jgi:hypothetical protein
VSYYSAGGYYEAGGFNLGKLGRWIGKQASNPLISGIVGMIPGGSSIVAGASLLASVSPKTHGAAVASSTAGTPGHNAAASAGGGRRRRTRRRRRSW